jgi:hypothetical protein
MDRLQKIFFLLTTALFFLTFGLGKLIKSNDVLYHQRAFYHLFARYDPVGAVLLILILFAVVILIKKIPESSIDLILAKIENNPFKITLVTFFCLSLGAVLVYHAHPLSMDEYMPYFQAQIFSQGKLWGKYPPELVPWLLQPKFFSVYSVETGRVVSDYWPGFALLLTPFMRLGVPWLLNPLIGAATLLLLCYYTGKVLPDNQATAWVLLLTIASTAFSVNSISFYSMNGHLFLNLLYASLFLNRSPLRLFLAGFVGSIALVPNNPVPHMLFSLPWIIWLAIEKGRIKNLGLLFSGYLPVSLLLGFGWVWLKMSIAKGGALVIAGAANSVQPKMQSHPMVSSNIISNLFQKAVSRTRSVFEMPDFSFLLMRLIGLLKLFAWAVPGLPILAVLGTRYLKGNRHLQLWMWSAICTFVGYMFVPVSQGHGWGFRYFHSAWIALPLLATAFLTSETIKNSSWKQFIGATALLSLVLCTGLRFYQVHQFVGQHLSQLPVLEEGKRYVCILNTKNGFYVEDLIQNDPFLGDPVIILKSLNHKEDQKMMNTIFPKAKLVSKSESVNVWEIPETVK